MIEIKIYIIAMEREADGHFDLQKYSRGEFKSGWFLLPVTREKILDQIGVDIEKDEYWVDSYEGEVFIPGHFRTVEKFNNLYEKLKELDGTPLEGHVPELQVHFIRDLIRLIDAQEYFKFYPGYSDYKEFARDMALTENPKAGAEEIASYEEYVETSGHYLIVSDGIFEYDV